MEALLGYTTQIKWVARRGAGLLEGGGAGSEPRESHGLGRFSMLLGKRGSGGFFICLAIIMHRFCPIRKGNAFPRLLYSLGYYSTSRECPIVIHHLPSTGTALNSSEPPTATLRQALGSSVYQQSSQGTGKLCHLSRAS